MSEYPRLSSLDARPLLALAHSRRIPSGPALPLPPVKAASHNLRNPPSGPAPPTFQGIPLRWPLREAGRGQPRAPSDWLAQLSLGSTPLCPRLATGSPPFQLLRLGCSLVAFNPYVDQPGMHAPGFSSLKARGRWRQGTRGSHRTSGSRVKRPIPGYTEIEMLSVAGCHGPRQDCSPLV